MKSTIICVVRGRAFKVPTVADDSTDRLTEAGIDASVGSVGDSYDNALAEAINGAYKAERIYRKGPWRSYEGPRRGSTPAYALTTGRTGRRPSRWGSVARA